MSQQDEHYYRKWISICENFKDVPLRLNLTGGNAVFNVGNRALLEMTREEFSVTKADAIANMIKERMT